MQSVRGKKIFRGSYIFITEMFFYAVVDEACRATIVLLIAAVTRELVHCFFCKHNQVLEIGHLSLVHLRSVEVWDRARLRTSQ